VTPEEVHAEVLRLEQRLESATSITDRLARIEIRLDAFETRLDGLGDRLARLETRIDGLQWTVRGLYGLLAVAVFVNHFWK
jgi:uncharacterized coiled-coil protein SlyX